MTTKDASNASGSQSSPGSKSSIAQTSVTCQHLQGGGSDRSPNSSSNTKENYDQVDHVIHHHHKKSVLMRVKEKARKLKKSLSGRKRRDEHEPHSPYITPPGSAGSLKDNDKDRSEYFGTPLYEPQVAPETNKQLEKQHSQESNKKSDLSKNKTSTLDSNDTDTSSKQSGLTIWTHEEKENERSSVQSQDKGVSVKEYIMNKFEPGDDERALSQVITQTISPKYEKVKEAMNSLLGNEEASESTSTPSSSLNESSDRKLTSLTDHPNLSKTLESNLSNASSICQCSTSTPASPQNQNLGSSSTSSNLKPNAG